jgi:hypothetical protein
MKVKKTIQNYVLFALAGLGMGVWFGLAVVLQ